MYSGGRGAPPQRVACLLRLVADERLRVIAHGSHGGARLELVDRSWRRLRHEGMRTPLIASPVAQAARRRRAGVHPLPVRPRLAAYLRAAVEAVQDPDDGGQCFTVLQERKW